MFRFMIPKGTSGQLMSANRLKPSEERICRDALSRFETLSQPAVSASAGPLAGETFRGQYAGKGAGAPSLIALLITFLIAVAGMSGVAAERGKSEWVYAGPNGKLIYKTTPAGDRIMDFSHAGYMGGGGALPLGPVRRTLNPSGGDDDSAAVQAALNEVAAMDLTNGFRGAVLLGRGTFFCSNTITIPASGVVLRGSGSACGANKGEPTTIKLTGKPHLAIAIRAPGRGRGPGDRPSATNSAVESQEFKPAETAIADDYVPSGAMAFTVSDARGFSVGDTIEIRRPVTEAWIKFMQMHNLVRDGRPQIWIREGEATVTERRIAAISGKQIALDVPLSDSVDSKYLNPPGTSVVKIRPPTRISQAGLEPLRIESPPQAIN